MILTGKKFLGVVKMLMSTELHIKWNLASAIKLI